jgi:hypothetical protein
VSQRLRFRFDASREDGTKFLRQYAEALAAHGPAGLSADDQLAYWLNLHNLLVLAHVSSTGGKADMENDRGRGDAPGPAFTAKLITVAGVPLSLDDIERGIVMAHWNDARVIYGLYHGSAGGPAMADAAYTGQTVWAMLDAGAKRYVGSSAGLQVTRKGAEVSAIYAWYADPYFPDDSALRTHLETFAPATAKAGLAKATTFTTRAFSYKTDNEIARVAPISPETRQPRGFPTGS